MSFRPTSFFDLPPELRIKVYGCLLVAPDPISMEIRGDETPNKLHPEILRTCRQINEEASAVLYGTNEFFIERIYGSNPHSQSISKGVFDICDDNYDDVEDRINLKRTISEFNHPGVIDYFLQKHPAAKQLSLRFHGDILWFTPLQCTQVCLELMCLPGQLTKVRALVINEPDCSEGDLNEQSTLVAGFLRMMKKNGPVWDLLV